MAAEERSFAKQDGAALAHFMAIFHAWLLLPPPLVKGDVRLSAQKMERGRVLSALCCTRISTSSELNSANPTAAGVIKISSSCCRNPSDGRQPLRSTV